MAEYTIPKGSKVITSIKRNSHRILGLSVTANTVASVQVTVFIPRLGTITPLEWDVSFGPTSFSVSRLLEWYLTLVDVDNLPLISGVSSRAIWSTLQKWLVLSAVGFGQIMTREIQDFFNPASFNFTEVADYTQRLGLVLLCICDSSITVDSVGVLTYREDLVQRKFGGDNTTFETDNGQWEDCASDEESQDQDEG